MMNREEWAAKLDVRSGDSDTATCKLDTATRGLWPRL